MKRVGQLILLCALLILALPWAARAQAKQGDKEVQIAGNAFTLLSSETTSTNGQFQFGLGYFVNDRLEVAVSPVVSISSSTTSTPVFNAVGQVISSNRTTDVSGDLGVATKVQYFFGATASKVKPYVGGAFIVQSFKSGTNGSIGDNTYLGGNAGVKNYFTDKAALDMSGSFGFRPSAPGDFQLFQFTIGLTYLF
jgi:outer membrane protein W